MTVRRPWRKPRAAKVWRARTQPAAGGSPARHRLAELLAVWPAHCRADPDIARLLAEAREEAEFERDESGQ